MTDYASTIADAMKVIDERLACLSDMETRLQRLIDSLAAETRSDEQATRIGGVLMYGSTLAEQRKIKAEVRAEIIDRLQAILDGNVDPVTRPPANTGPR